MRISRQSPALVVAFVALLAALSGSAVAGGLISGSKIKKHSIAGNRMKSNTLTGKQIKESKLGKVPKAATADALAGANVQVLKFSSTDSPVTGATVATVGSLTIKVSCDDTPNKVKVTVEHATNVTTEQTQLAGNTSSTGGNADLSAATPFTIINASFGAAAQSTVWDTDGHVYQLQLAAKTGGVNGAKCVVGGTAISG